MSNNVGCSDSYSATPRSESEILMNLVGHVGVLEAAHAKKLEAMERRIQILELAETRRGRRKMDSDGYPTTSELRKIRNWRGTFRELWEYVTGLWHWPNYAVTKRGETVDELELHTGGWSGNEDIADALEHSKSLFCFFCETKWERGGHYYFEVPHSYWKIIGNQRKDAAREGGDGQA